MPGDLIISDASLAPAPKETPVPASTRYIVKQVQALYTDNGAGGAWLPALEIVSDAGIVTGRYVGESVAAGSGQEVTWFPLGSKGAAAAAVTPEYADFRLFTGSVSGTTVTMRWTLDHTSDPTNFSVDAGDDKKIDVQQDGYYLVVADAQIGFTLPLTIAKNLRASVNPGGAQDFWTEYLLAGKPSTDFPGSAHNLGQTVGIIDTSVGPSAPFFITATMSPTQANFNFGFVRLKIWKLG